MNKLENNHSKGAINLNKEKFNEINEFYENFCFKSMKQLEKINDGIMQKEDITYEEVTHLKENISIVIQLNGEL